MSATVILHLRTREVCQSVNIPEDLLRDCVAQGIIAPIGASPIDWLFDANMVGTLRRALRLQRELEIDWAGVAVALDLLKELDELRSENRMLRQRLARFMNDTH